jgi:hypothetical protein
MFVDEQPAFLKVDRRDVRRRGLVRFGPLHGVAQSPSKTYTQ